MAIFQSTECNIWLFMNPLYTNWDPNCSLKNNKSIVEQTAAKERTDSKCINTKKPLMVEIRQIFKITMCYFVYILNSIIYLLLYIYYTDIRGYLGAPGQIHKKPA